jgi:hypothetical protein
MNRRHSNVRICPDCGGILQPTGPEALTSAELAAVNDPEAGGTRQCLLCGFIDAAQEDPVPEPVDSRSRTPAVAHKGTHPQREHAAPK